MKQSGSTDTHHSCEGTEVEQGAFRVDYSTRTILWYTVTGVASDIFFFLVIWHLDLGRGSAFAVWLLGWGNRLSEAQLSSAAFKRETIPVCERREE